MPDIIGWAEFVIFFILRPAEEIYRFFVGTACKPLNIFSAKNKTRLKFQFQRELHGGINSTYYDHIDGLENFSTGDCNLHFPYEVIEKINRCSQSAGCR